MENKIKYGFLQNLENRYIDWETHTSYKISTHDFITKEMLGY